jgi:hypothetical protein
MIATNKSKPKHLRIEVTSHARKSNKSSSKKTRKSHKPQGGNRRDHESFHTLGGQILYEPVKKIKTYGAEKWEAVRLDRLPRNPRAIIYEFLWVGRMTKLPLELKLRYKPLKGK